MCASLIHNALDNFQITLILFSKYYSYRYAQGNFVHDIKGYKSSQNALGGLY